MSDTDKTDLTTLTVDLLAAYVANNSVRSEDLATLIQSTHKALASIEQPSAAAETPAAAEYTPAVSARKSLSSREHIISLIDGKPYKTLKRHLSGHGLTPADYRQRYNLPANYPMVAPGYSEQRRAVAHALGLGRKPRVATPAAEPAPAPAAAAAPKVPAKRGRKPGAAKAVPAAAAAPAKRGRKPKAVAPASAEG